MHSLRLQKMRKFIEKEDAVTIKQLQQLFPDVSLMTIHRDLDALAQEGIIIKVRGGARKIHHSGDLGFDVRIQENNPGKYAMAQKALALIQPYSTVFLDASTTNLILARCLPDMNLNIFTTGPNIGMELCRLRNPNITLCCGTINRKNMAVSGQNTLEMLDKINIDLAFIGVSGCNAEAGFTCGTESDMAVKRKVIEKARTSVVMCDQAKFSRLMPYTFARFEDINYLISDDSIPESVFLVAETAGVKML